MKTGLFLAALVQLAAAVPLTRRQDTQFSGASGGTKNGIVYSPYNGDGTCKTQDEVNSDFQQLVNYSLVRIYGTDCDQTTTVGNAAKANGMRIMMGIYSLNDLAYEVGLIKSGINGDWDMVSSVTVGNEMVNSGEASVDQVVQAVNDARGLLRGVGYTGPVVTVDTFNTVIDNPQLCQASDFPAVNAHAFFDHTIAAPKAGGWLEYTVKQVKDACGRMPVVTETGWPHAGEANGLAIPGMQEQAQALNSIASYFDQNVFYFTAFDDMWKQNNPSTFGAEQFWGIYGTD